MNTMAEVGSFSSAVSHLRLQSLKTLRLRLSIPPRGDTYVYLVFTQVVESTIFARATIDKSCDERLDVEKGFPSLVSYFVFHVADNLLVHKINQLVQLIVLYSDAVDMTFPLDIFEQRHRNHRLRVHGESSFMCISNL